MPSMQTIIQIILTAIVSIGILSAGMRAVEESLKSYVETKKNTVVDFCRVKTEQIRVSNRIMSQFTLTKIQGDCINAEQNKVDQDFKTAFTYIACFKEAFIQQETSGSVTTSSSSPTCSPTSGATPTTP